MLPISRPRTESVPRSDWLVGGDRHAIAAERIYAAATDMITREGLETFDIDRLAKKVHCSRATVYRYVGGKAEIRDAVVARTASRIIETVRQHSRGDERAGAGRHRNHGGAQADPSRSPYISS
jgi:AcrR family transcriptional regulator